MTRVSLISNPKIGYLVLKFSENLENLKILETAVSKKQICKIIHTMRAYKGRKFIVQR